MRIMAYLDKAALLALSWLMCSVVLAQSFHPGTAARVNGVTISNQRFDAFYEEYRRMKNVAVGARGDQLELMKRLRREAMDLIIEQELVVQVAAETGIKVSDKEIEAAYNEVSEPFKDKDEFLRRLDTEGFDEDGYREHLRRMITAAKYLDGIQAGAMQVSDEKLETYYHANEYRLTLPEQLRVRHILLSWKPLGKPDDRAALYEQMNTILEKARAGQDFALLATEYSDDSTRVNGGDVGLFRRGQMVPAFEAMAFSLEPGEISDIVETTYGLHILKLEERKPARLLPLDEVREQLRDHIRKENMETSAKNEIARLKENADIEILIMLERPKND